MSKKHVITVIIILIVVVIPLGIWKISKIKSKAERRHRLRQAVGAMSLKHNAINGWDKDFVNHWAKKVEGGHRNTFTVDVENALVNADEQPVLFFGGAADAKKRGEKNTLTFYTSTNITITFVLTAESYHLREVMAQPIDGSAYRYAVVAVISSIERPPFEVDAYEEDGEPYILVEPGDEFIAYGRCLDLLFVGDYSP